MGAQNDYGSAMPELVALKERKPADWVPAARVVTRKSQMDLAIDCEVDKTTIYRWEDEGAYYLEWMGVLAILRLPLDEWIDGPPAEALQALAVAELTDPNFIRRRLRRERRAAEEKAAKATPAPPKKAARRG